jgi:NAD(P)H-hydrate repair Nnr-like enzyme with NAD(P)H-hydrate dehydratase domain
MQIEFSKRYSVFVILKGKYTCITCPDGMSYFNPTGNPGMAKGGSGDTLTGMITGFLAQGYSPKESCIAGVYLHGLAADIAVKETGENSLLASDIIDNIGKAFLKLT